MRTRSVSLCLLLAGFGLSSLLPAAVFNGNPATFSAMLAQLQPGDTLNLAGGTYPPITISGKRGNAGAWITITGPASGSPAIIAGSSCCNTVEIVNSSFVAIKNLTIDSKGLVGVFGISAKDGASNLTHDILIEGNTLVGQNGSQTTDGISTKTPTWGWVIRNNVITGAGTGMYLGDSNGTEPFVAGLIEHNLIQNTTGYNLQIKWQLPRPTVAGMPTGQSTTIVRDNVFIKGDQASPDGPQPNLYLGGFPDSGAGSTDMYEVYGNFFYHNPQESLFQAEGRVSLHDNVFVDGFLAAVAFQPNNLPVKVAYAYNNTIYTKTTGIRFASGGASTDDLVTGNLIFAGTPTSGPIAHVANNITDTFANAGTYVKAPSLMLGSMDFYPLAGKAQGATLDLSKFASAPDYSIDFNKTSKTAAKGAIVFRGAYAGEGTNPGWQLQAAIKPASSGAPPPPPLPPQITTPSLPAGQVGVAYSATLAASGGTPLYSWSISAGSLPANLTLTTGGALSGTPTASGVSTFTVRVTDASSPVQSATRQLSITVSAAPPPPPLPPQITTSSLSAGQVGAAYSATLAASGGTPLYSWSISAGSLPANLTLTAGGAISGTPTVSGVSTFTVRVTDASSPVQSATRQLSIDTTTAAGTLLITTASLPDGQVHSGYSATLGASGGTPPYSWSISAGSLPAGLTLSSRRRAIRGTPTASGLSTFTLRVADSAAPPHSATKQLSINVIAGTLRMHTTNLPGGQLTVAYNTTMAGEGGTPPYTWSVLGTLPAGLSLNSAGALSGTPTTAATSAFTIQMTDAASQTASAPFRVRVTGAATASAFNHVVVVVEEGMKSSDAIGSSLTPYLNSLASTYGSATEYHANTKGSIGNYLWMITGTQITDEDTLDRSTPVSVNNVVRQLLAGGKTWKSYAEDLPSAGYTGGDTGKYSVRHNPFAYLADVQDSATQRQNLVPFTQFETDLGNNALPNYSFVVPNLCNDAQDCGRDVADNWLQTHIAPLVNNANFRKDGMLIILFDQSSDDDGNGGGPMPFLVVTPQGKTHFQSTTFYQHPSLLRLTLQALGIKNWPGAASSAPSMSEFFTVPLP